MKSHKHQEIVFNLCLRICFTTYFLTKWGNIANSKGHEIQSYDHTTVALRSKPSLKIIGLWNNFTVFYWTLHAKIFCRILSKFAAFYQTSLAIILKAGLLLRATILKPHLKPIDHKSSVIYMHSLTHLVIYTSQQIISFLSIWLCFHVFSLASGLHSLLRMLIILLQVKKAC